jgi:hypothetical protein
MPEQLKRNEKIIKRGLPYKNTGRYLHALKSSERGLDSFNEIQDQSQMGGAPDHVENTNQTVRNYKQKAFDRIISFHVSQGNYRLAFFYTELSKSRALMELLLNTKDAQLYREEDHQKQSSRILKPLDLYRLVLVH